MGITLARTTQTATGVCEGRIGHVYPGNLGNSGNPEGQSGCVDRLLSAPTGDHPEENKLISGVDTLLAISEDSKHKEEAQRFIQFLLEPENSKQYITEQTLFSTVEGVTQDDPAVAERALSGAGPSHRLC